MELDKNIKIKDGFWKVIPFLANKTAQGIYPNVYLPKHIFYDIKSKNPNPYNVGLLFHEQEHVKRQRKFGIIKWLLKYMFSPKFRFNEEILADIPRNRYLKSKKLEFDIEKRAKQLSGWLYLWPVTYKVAKEKLKELA